MSWLPAWLIFSLLAAREFGAIAAYAGGGDVQALAYVVGSIACFCVVAGKAMRQDRPAGMRALVVISLLALVLSLGSLHFVSDHVAWAAALMFGAVYSAICLLAGSVVLVVSWWRARAEQARVAEVHEERERHRRMEGIRAQTAALAAAASSEHDTPGPDSDFTLPSRPKWEES